MLNFVYNTLTPSILQNLVMFWTQLLVGIPHFNLKSFAMKMANTKLVQLLFRSTYIAISHAINDLSDLKLYVTMLIPTK